MKILMIITGMQSGGAERVMATLCNELCKKNQVRLAIIKNSTSDYVLSENIEVTFGNVTNQNVNESVKFIKMEMETWKPDVAVSFMTKTNIVTLLAEKKCENSVPVIIAERANPYYEKTIFKLIRRFLYPRATGCVFQTEMASNYYKRIIKCESIVLRNPLNPDFYTETYKGKRTKRIVSVGRLSSEKNQKLLIKSFGKVATKYPDYKVEIYGDGPLKEELQLLIDNQENSAQIKLMGRKYNIQKYIRDAEIFVHPSNSEGMPNALLEAMALGCSCIATDCPIGGSAFIIENEKNGILIPMNDEERLCNELERLINNPEFARTLGKRAEKVIQDFAPEKVCEEWEEYIYRIAQRKRKRV